jgi:hypothetical protein
MRRDTKFNYGLLFVGLALPTIAEYFLGRYGVIAAIVVGVVGAIFLVSVHTHSEDGRTSPISGSKKMVAFALVGVVVSLAIMGLRSVYAREFAAGHPTSQSAANQSSGPPTQNQPEPPKASTTPVPKQAPQSAKPSKQTQANSGNHNTQQQQQQHNSGGTNTQQQSSGNNSPNITQLGPCSVAQTGNNDIATVNCAPPSGTELAKFGAGTVVQVGIVGDPASHHSFDPIATGFWLNNKGYIATCLHSLRGRDIGAFVPMPPLLGRNLTVASGGMTTRLEQIVSDQETDLAIVHVIGSPFERSMHMFAQAQKLDEQGRDVGKPEISEEQYWVPAMASDLAQSGDDVIRVTFIQQDGMPVVNYDFGHITRMGVASTMGSTKKSYRIYASVPFKDSDCGAPIINNAKTVIGMVGGSDGASSIAIPSSYILDVLNKD